jgi:hypothetical protein
VLEALVIFQAVGRYLGLGRNEGGAQYVHGWLDALLVTADEDLNALFRNGIDAGRITNY